MVVFILTILVFILLQVCIIPVKMFLAAKDDVVCLNCYFPTFTAFITCTTVFVFSNNVSKTSTQLNKAIFYFFACC